MNRPKFLNTLPFLYRCQLDGQENNLEAPEIEWPPQLVQVDNSITTKSDDNAAASHAHNRGTFCSQHSISLEQETFRRNTEDTHSEALTMMVSIEPIIPQAQDYRPLDSAESDGESTSICDNSFDFLWSRTSSVGPAAFAYLKDSKGKKPLESPNTNVAPDGVAPLPLAETSHVENIRKAVKFHDPSMGLFDAGILVIGFPPPPGQKQQLLPGNDDGGSTRHALSQTFILTPTPNTFPSPNKTDDNSFVRAKQPFYHDRTHFHHFSPVSGSRRTPMSATSHLSLEYINEPKPIPERICNDRLKCILERGGPMAARLYFKFDSSHIFFVDHSQIVSIYFEDGAEKYVHGTDGMDVENSHEQVVTRLKKRKRQDSEKGNGDSKILKRPPSLVIQFRSCSFRIFSLLLPSKKTNEEFPTDRENYVDDSSFETQKKILQQFLEKIEAFFESSMVDFPNQEEKLLKRSRSVNEGEASGSSDITIEAGQKAIYRASSTDDDVTSSGANGSSENSSGAKKLVSAESTNKSTDMQNEDDAGGDSGKARTTEINVRACPLVSEAFATLPANARAGLLAPERLFNDVLSAMRPDALRQGSQSVMPMQLSFGSVNEECVTCCPFRDDGGQHEGHRHAAEESVARIRKDISDTVARMFPVPKMNNRSFSSWKNRRSGFSPGRVSNPSTGSTNEDKFLSEEEFDREMLGLEDLIAQHKIAVTAMHLLALLPQSI